MNMNLTELKESPHNARRTFDDAKLKELAASIKEKGILQDIIVRPVGKDFEIVCGARRFRAAKLAGLTAINVRIEKYNDKQALEAQVIENLQREDVHPLEEAEGYEALMKKHGYKDVKDIAAKVGKSATYIYGRLKLCELIPENRKFFYEGKFSPSVALLVARVPKELQKEAGKNIAKDEIYGCGNEPMTYKDAKEYVEEQFMLQMKEASWDPKEKGLGGKISCLECSKRTANSKELFADIQGADRCTDPGCFNAKKQALIQRKMAELKKSGKNLLPADQVENALHYGSNFIKLEDTQWINHKQVTYKDLAKKAKDADILYAIRPDNGKVVELITKPEAARILKKLGIKDGSDDTKTRGEKVAEHKTENRVDSTKRTFFIATIGKHMDQRVKNVLIASVLLACQGYNPDEDDPILDGVPMEFDFDKIYKLGDEKVKQIIERLLFLKPGDIEDTDQLAFLAEKLGFSMAKDYVITKEYLEACTKDELVKLAKELDKPFGGAEGSKKNDLVTFILKHAPKGRVPKELVK